MKQSSETSENEENLKSLDSSIDDMGYYCKLCQCFHNSDSKIGRAHRRYASQRPPRRTRKTQNVWERMIRWR